MREYKETMRQIEITEAARREGTAAFEERSRKHVRRVG